MKPKIKKRKKGETKDMNPPFPPGSTASNSQRWGRGNNLATTTRVYFDGVSKNGKSPNGEEEKKKRNQNPGRHRKNETKDRFPSKRNHCVGAGRPKRRNGTREPCTHKGGAGSLPHTKGFCPATLKHYLKMPEETQCHRKIREPQTELPKQDRPVEATATMNGVQRENAKGHHV